MSDLVQLIYVSSTVGLMSQDELKELLISARDANKKHGITGMLLHDHGNVMQVIEGPKAAIEQLYQNLENDPRHVGVIVLVNEPITEREFPEWSMSYQNLSGEEIDGFSKFMSSPSTDSSFPLKGEARELLYKFKG